MLRTATLAVALAGTVLLAGCASSKGLATHEHLRDAASLHSQQTLAGTPLSAAAWPSARWWSAFGDPQLNALMEEALAGAPSLAAADARARKAQAQAGLADAARKPTLGGSAQVLGMQLPQTLAGNELGGKFQVADLLMLSFKYSPDLWGKDNAKWQAAVGNAHAAEVDAQAARLSLTANIARTYIALAQAFDLQSVAQAEHTRAEALVLLVQQRVKAGVDNGIALAQHQSMAAGAQQQVQAAQQHIDQLRTALAMLVAAGPDRGLAITRPQLAQSALAIPASLTSDLLAQRADLVAARWRVEAAQHGIDASKAAFYPSLNLSALAGLAAGNLGDLFGNKALLLNGGPALSLPIFEGGQLRNQLRASQADADLAVANYNQTLLSAIHDVADAVQTARTLDAQIATTTQARTAAATAFSNVQQRQRAGLASRLDSLNAQKPVLQLEQQLATLVAARRSASVDLDQALGGGIAIEASISPDAAAQTTASK
jgi:NodT family efflux transporter outer membrane factor (OMF) lipoprotein